MKPLPVKSILFDFGGTLDSDGSTWLDRFYVIYKEVGLVVDRAGFERAFYDSDDNLARLNRLDGLGLEQTLLLQTRAVVSVLAPERLPLHEEAARRFLAQSREAFARNRPVLGRLRRSYRLGIVSNFYGNLDSCLRGEGLRDFFDVVADSGVVGCEKPAPGIFKSALAALAVEARDCLMVGDSIPRDMRGAEGLAMRHALVSADPSRRCCPEALTLRDISELEAHVS